MAGVMMPQQKKSQTGDLLTIGGAVAGGVTGGPSGAMMGAQAGGMAQGILGGSKQPAQPVQSTAMQRRMNTYQQDPGLQLAQADAALAQLPSEYQQAYGPSIKQARHLDAQSRGVV